MPAAALSHRHHAAAGLTSDAVYSACGRYRYALTRTWEESGPRLLYIMLNPSRATEARNDPTIARCERRARALGFGAFRATNIFAWRETSPHALRRADDPVGPDNDAILLASLTDWLRTGGDLALCGWGAHGDHRDRGRIVGTALHRTGRPLHCLGTTRSGQPRHPLYIAYATAPRRWAPAGLAAPR